MVRFFGANDKYTLDEAIDYLRFEQSKQFNYSGALRKKKDRDEAAYAGRLLTDIIKVFEETRDNGPTPPFITEKLGRTETKPTNQITVEVPGHDLIAESVAPGGNQHVYATYAPLEGHEFINWLADQQGPVLWIQEIFPGQFGINQFAMESHLIRRVVMASRAHTICVRTRNDGKHTVTHTYDRGKWLANTDSRLHDDDGDIFQKLGLPRPEETVR